ncbi:putative HFM1 protein [Danaus plexippus plexippus]|uniref:DNA 3'-5' helicase n=1 Tax=Danaus plexippus plexippus TaxID=278856 RepID=A0A212EHY5_DANPL|nr:putative HFM1 protein [Danaus plexippus plexippus]
MRYKLSCKISRYQSLVGGCEPLQSYLHKRLAENINSEVALGTIRDVAQCVQWLNSTFLRVRAVKDPKRYLGLPQTATEQLISKKIEELCIRAMNGLQSSGLITMDELAWIESTEAGRLMSMHYLDLETMKLIMKIDGDASLDRLLWLICESHELSDMYLRTDERRCLNTLNRNNNSSTIRYQMKGKITTREMKLNCIIQAVLGCLPIPDPSLNQEALKIMRIADRVCKCLVSYITRPNFISDKPKFYSAILNSITLAKCITAHLWENSLYVSRQLKGIGPTFSTLLVTAVGIDRQCEYFFQDINPFSNKDISHNKIPQTISPKIQTHTDKEGCDRKRKINNKKSIPYVEKKKRESIEDFLTKKEPFERNTKCLIGNSNISMENNQKIPEKSESLEVKCDIISNNQKAVDNEFAYQIDEDDFLEEFDYEEVDDEKIDELLNGIENEVNRPSTSASSHMYIQKTEQDHYTNSSKRLKTNDYKEPKNKSNMKNNFTFIDRIEKNIENDNDNMTNKTTGLSEAVKNHIQQYLRETKSNMKCIGTNLSELNKNLNTDTPNFTSEEKNEVNDNDNFRPEIIDLTVSETEKYNCPTKNYNAEEIRSKALGSETVENTDGDITHEVAEIFLEHNEIDSIEIENDRAGTEIIDKEMFNIKEKPQNECLRLSHFNENPKKDIKTTDIQLTLRTSPDTQKRSTQNSNVICIGSDFETRLYDQDSVKNPEAIPETCSQKPLNTYRTQENESRTSLHQDFQSPLNPTKYNLDINDRNMKNEGSFKDIRKYSYNEVKTVSFHKENITRICTLNVALDVTDIVHTNNEPIISEYNFDAKNESTSYYKKDSNTPTDLKTDGSKTFIKSDYSYEFNTKHQIREVKKTDKIAQEKAQNTNQIIQGEDKKTTIRDILMKYNKNDPIQSCSKNVETESLLGTYQIERSELKPRRKYRISDLEKIDVTLPASLIPSQNTNHTLSFETKTEPNLHFTNLEEIQDEIITNKTNDEHNDSSTDTNEDCNKLDLEETDLNLECELTVNDSFNFDEAILDPKTLLQSNSNNEVIIPPPAEFCDNSPDASPQINFPNNDSVYDPQHSALDDNNEVSPTSFNDEIKDIFTSNFSQYSNFAVHNQSSSGIVSPSVNNRNDLVKSRSYKLSQFKFNRKRMFKK